MITFFHLPLAKENLTNILVNVCTRTNTHTYMDCLMYSLYYFNVHLGDW